MAIDRHDNGSADDGPFDDGGRDRRPGQDRPETPDHRDVPGSGPPVLEEVRGRAELYGDLRAELRAEPTDWPRAERPEKPGREPPEKPEGEAPEKPEGEAPEKPEGEAFERPRADGLRAESDTQVRRAAGAGMSSDGDSGKTRDTSKSGDANGPKESPGRDSAARDHATDSDARPARGDAPRTTDDGGWEWKGLRLGPDANRVADDAIAARRSAEGRDGAGNYGEHGITPAMRRIEAALEHGSLVPDTEKFALKSPDRFKEKLAKAIGVEPDRAPSEISAEIHDGIRYTFSFEAKNYASGVEDARHRLSDYGYELIAFKPSWDSDEYKGINSQWMERGSGLRFEVQFHTPESWEAKQSTHEAYVKIESPTTPPAERAQLRDYQREISASVPVPPGALEFFPFKHKEG
jgi:hypothetical protein